MARGRHGQVDGEEEKLKTGSRIKKAAAVLPLTDLAFAAGWHLSPDRTAAGYGLRNQDGHSAGYNDGTAPDQNRFILPEDHALRGRLGGRDPGE